MNRNLLEIAESAMRAGIEVLNITLADDIVSIAINDLGRVYTCPASEIPDDITTADIPALFLIPEPG